MTRPRILDLFCGAGGAARGYADAGFEPVGVDIAPQPRYPYEFFKVDAIELLEDIIDNWPTGAALPPLDSFAAIHASPPCQRYTKATHSQRKAGKEYPDLLGPARDLLSATGLPWVIENVPGAPMRADYRLCGCLFGLGVRRERWFETSWHGFGMRPPCHHVGYAVTVCGHGDASRSPRRLSGLPGPTADEKRAAMGIDWMNRDELAEAIPPPYTRFVGEQLLAHLRAGVTR